jgi:Ca-activated chloride channel family protein
VSVRGRRNGRPEDFQTALVDREGSEARYVEQLWAARKAGALSREIRLRGQTRELIEALKQLALRYGVLTEYTAYLVQEPTVVARQREEQRVLQAPAAAPRDQAGSGAVAKAAREGAMSSALYLDGIVVTGVGEAGRSGMTPAGAPTRRVDGRLFILRDSTWTDLSHGDSLHVVTVAPFSAAYVALLRAMPELVPVAGLEPAVLVAGRRASIKIETGGKEHWITGELERLLREFR